MSDTFWNDLGVTWRAEVPDVKVFASNLRTRVERQRSRERHARLMSAFIALFSFGYGAWLLYSASLNDAPAMVSANRTYMTVGIFLMCVGVVPAAIHLWVHTVRQRGDTTDLPNMLEMVIAQAERHLRNTWAGCILFAILLALMLAAAPLLLPGAAMLLKTPAGAIVVTIWIAICVGMPVWMLVHYRRAKSNLANYRRLQALFAGRSD